MPGSISSTSCVVGGNEILCDLPGTFDVKQMVPSSIDLPRDELAMVPRDQTYFGLVAVFLRKA